MGFLRTYLAVCVVAAHSSPVLPWGTHGGREAVQIFFAISGFYMQLVLGRGPGGGKYRSARAFYASRALRIYPPYFAALLFVAGVSAAWAAATDTGYWLTLDRTLRGPAGGGPGAGPAGSAVAVGSNFTLLFQDWVMFLGDDGGGLRLSPDFRRDAAPLYEFLWIPQCWTVGVELTFYLCAPLLARRASTRTLLVLAAALLARVSVYRAATGAADPWTYRFFPFELTQFVIGMLGCRWMTSGAGGRVCRAVRAAAVRARAARPRSAAVGGAIALGAGLWVHLAANGAARAWAARAWPPAGEYAYLLSLAGWGVLLPVLFSATRDDPADRGLGELSYPIYLVHYTVALVVWGAFVTAAARFPAAAAAAGRAADGLGLPGGWSGPASAAASIGVAAAAYVALLRPFEAWRQRWAARRRPAGPAPAG